MSDMLNRMSDYLPPDHQKAFAPLLDYDASLESDGLREEFDRYMAEEASSLTAAIASIFISMLLKRTALFRASK